jgi:peptidoglycan/xylan/chitin deacetylase (PgdA/CDA1 family)
VGHWFAASALYFARISNSRIGFALVYHGLVPAPVDQSGRAVPVLETERFTDHMRHLSRHYDVVQAGDLLDAVRKRRRASRFPVAVTFDDDLPSHVSLALPILQRLRISATFFLCGASLVRHREFWWERLERVAAAGSDLQAPLKGMDVGDISPGSVRAAAAAIERLSPECRALVDARLARLAGQPPETSGITGEDVRTLANSGMTVGFHTVKHDALPSLDDATLGAALRVGRRELELAANREVRIIGYPHGDANERVAYAARAAGYDFGFCARQHVIRWDCDPLLMDRLSPDNDPGGVFAVKLVGAIARSIFSGAG